MFYQLLVVAVFLVVCYCGTAFLYKLHVFTRIVVCFFFPIHWLHAFTVHQSGLRTADLGSNPTFHEGIFCGTSHTSDLKIGTQVATLPGAWQFWVSAGTGWPSVSKL